MLFRLCLATCLALGVSAAFVSCPSSGSTFAVRGCNNTYTHCHNGRRSEMKCPENLYFNADTLECQYAHDFTVCINRDVEWKVATDDLPACTTEQDGTILASQIRCSQKFVICDHGNAVLKSCPYQQFYSARLKRCDRKQKVEGCNGELEKEEKAKKAEKNLKIRGQRVKIAGAYGGDVEVPANVVPTEPAQTEAATPYDVSAKPPAAAAPAYGPGVARDEPVVDQVTTAAPVVKKDAFDCASRADGHYKALDAECTTFFWNCANKKAYKYECPKGLYYDGEDNQCNYRHTIPSCGGKRPPPTTPEPARAPVAPATNFDCKGKAEGSIHVEAECSKEFIQCVGGFASLLKCPSNLVYDMRTGACDYLEVCKGPAPQAKPDLAHGSPQAYGPVSPVKITYDCSQKKDGFYATAKCISEYVACNGEIATAHNCPSDLVFSEEKMSCDFKSVCLNPPAPTTKAPLVPATLPPVQNAQPQGPYGSVSAAPPAYSGPSEIQTNQVVPLAPVAPVVAATPAPARDLPVIVSCKKLTNGAHATERCSAKYVNCWGGLGTPSACPSTLIFNPYNQQCDYSSNVPECPEYKGNEIGQSPAQPTPAVPRATQKPIVVEPFCERLADGTYSTGCSNFYYVCQNQMTTKLFCPVGLFFDLKASACHMKEHIVACGAQPKPTAPYGQIPTQPVVPAPQPMPQQSPPSYGQPPAHAPPVQPNTAMCQGKKEGIYGMGGCTPEFLQCYGQMASVAKCQNGLFYNDLNGMCDYKENVVACGGKLPAPVVPQAPAQPAPAYGQQTPAASPPAFNCVGRSDGYFAAGCSDQYFSCLGGVAAQHKCQSGLKFSLQTLQCNYDSAVPECGGKAPAPVQNLATPPPAPVSSFCSGKKDAIFQTEACSSNYMACVSEQSYPGVCRGGLIFNDLNGSCDYKQNVPSCQQAQSPPVQQPIPAPLPTQPIAFSCGGLTDGYYAPTACSPKYVHCQMERATTEGACPTGLIFNTQKQQCSYRANVVECNPQQPQQPVVTAPVPQPIPQQPIAQQPMRDVPQPQLNNPFCATKKNGIYGQGCSRQYIICSNGQTVPFHCPMGLVFDVAQARCVFMAQSAACNTNMSSANSVVPSAGQYGSR